MIIRSIEDPALNLLIAELATVPIVAFDIETTGLNVRKDQITDLAFCTGKQTYNIIHKEWNGAELVEVVSKADLQQIVWLLQRKKLRTHNGSFDTRFVHHYFGVDLWESIFEDSMLMAHTENENRFNYGLKELGTEIFGALATAEKEAMQASIEAAGGSKKEFYKADSTIRATYAMKDVKLTWDLCEHFGKELVKQELMDFYRDEVNALYTNVTIPMELKGVPVDVPLLKQTQTEITADLDALEADIQTDLKPLLSNFEDWYVRTKYPIKLTGEFKQELASYLLIANWPLTANGTYSFALDAINKAVKKGLIDTNSLLYEIATGRARVPEEVGRNVQLQLLAKSGTKYIFNLLSTDHLKRLFFKSAGGLLDEKALSFTDLGNPQINDEFLEAMAVKYKWAAKLQVYRSLNKIKSTYVDRFLEGQEEGTFYPAFHQHRTVSGRYSGDLQQLSRPIDTGDERVIKYTNLIRRFFIAGAQHTFADFDYDSQEVKVFAHVSGDEGLKAIFAKGHDFYSTICIEAEKLEGYSADKSAPNYLGKVNKAARQRAKAYALGLAFGMTPYKLKFELNCSEGEAQRIYDGYMKAYPKLANWMKWTKETVCRTGTIRTEAGRVRRSPELRRAYAEHGEILFDGLELWQEYNERPETYKKMKETASRCKNALNNFYNHQIQGLAASITNRAAIKTATVLKGTAPNAYICNVTHDQITVRCDERDLDNVEAVLSECMETAYPISVPLTAPPSHGKNFAESK